MPPKTPPTLDEISRGPINTSRTLIELVVIAGALGIATDKQRKADLISAIKSKFENDPALGQQDMFIKFNNYRLSEIQGKKNDKNAQNSADKAAQDTLAAKQDLPATGANLKLLAGGVKSDPPPQHQRLSSPAPKKDAEEEEAVEFSSEYSSVPPTDEEGKGRFQTPPPKPQKQILKTPLPIVITINGPNKREFVIEPSDRVPVTIEKEGVNGTSPIYSISLKAALSEAFQSDSPMKANSKAKIYRGGLVDPSVPSVKLGSIEEILKDEKTGNLTMATLDKYTLKPFDDGVKKMLLCDVFLVSADDSDTKPAAAPSSAPPPTAPIGNAKPLVIQALTVLLRKIHEARSSPWPQAKTARVVRDRYVAVKDAVALMHVMGWNNSGGGFTVPSDSNIDGHDLKGMDFTKEFLQNALHVRHAHCPDATAWFDNPDDEELGPKFNLMAPTKFKQRLERLKEAAEKKTRRKKRGKGNKRVRPESDKGSGDEAGPSSKKKKSRKSKKEPASTDLDESSDSSSDEN
ncbi:hypothetical protein B0H14DRAFT_3498846 [Mycena olivaceomarginata]|nr:hypothetical protein B0H14DRAFT_3498846 [Mycena olivaceomarginata]